MKIALLTIGDGRDELHDRAVTSLRESVDWGDHEPIPFVIDDSDHELGFAGAIYTGWREIVAHRELFEYVFHFELDFVFCEEIRVSPMIQVLEEEPHLAQMSLKRQAVNPRELEAGGIVEADPDDFEQVVKGGSIWTEQRRYWTTNPCVYNANFCLQGWPLGPKSEGRWTQRLLADPELRFGIWGAKYDPPLIEHIGDERAGNGY